MRKNIFYKLTFLFAFISFVPQNAWAQFEEGKQEIVFGLPALNGTAIAVDSNNTTTYTNTSEVSKKIKNIITLKINENSNIYLVSSFTATVDLDVDTWETLSSSPVHTTKTLIVNYNKTDGATYNVRAYIVLPESEKVKITVTNVDVSIFSGAWDPLRVLQLENEMRVLKYYTLSDDPGILTPTFNTVVDDSDALHVSWIWNAAANNNMTQLEWAWVEDTLASFYPTIDSLFEINSTRVDLDYSQNNYKIPLLYDGEGKLYYRVRAVLRKNDGSFIVGPWSDPEDFSFDGHEPDLNWQSSTSFAENGKFKSVIQYFDGSLRNRQTVTKDNNNGNTIVAETIYDLQGRPNIQILPTPTIDNTIKYFKDFNRFIGQGLDGNGVIEDPAKYFDLTPAAVLCNRALALDSTYGNGKYYSIQNPWLSTERNAKYIPDAQGYAFTETRFMDDATERVRSQGGVGINYQINSGHETKYFYGKPSQQELDALFATEVGDASHYSKNMVRDANGQMSVSYVDMHGRTIATVLAGDTTTGISTIINNETDYPQATGTLTNQLLTPTTNIINGNSIESISTVLVPATTIYNFTYKLDPSILSQFSCTSQEICFDCKYDLEISIKSEECGDTTPIIRRYNNLQIATTNQCDTSMGFSGEELSNVKEINFTQTLGPGSWVIRKTLTINDSMFQVRRDSALKVFLCKTEQQIYDSIYNVLYTTSGCGNTPSDTAGCTSCLANLGTTSQYRDTYLMSIGSDTSNHLHDADIAIQYTQDSLVCANACGALNVELTSLQSLRNQLLNDMMPFTGQYAIDSVRDPVSGVATALTSSMAQSKYNIFTTSPSYGSYTKPFYKYPLNENGQSYYYTEDKQVDSMIHRHDESGQAILDTISGNEFSSLFQRSWAGSLIKYHPEYSKLRIAEDSLMHSYQWLDSIQAIDLFSTASANGFDNPLSLPSASSHPDPFFQMAGNSAYKDTMDKRIRQGINIDGSGNASGPTIWQLANSAVLCDGIDSAYKAICTINLPAEAKTGISPDITDAGAKNRVWETFRGIYLGYRNEMVLKYIDGKSGVLSRNGMDSLLSENKQLVFVNMKDAAAQNGAASWWSMAASGDTTHLRDSTSSAINTYNTDKCLGQKPFWKARLLQCEALISLLNNKTNSDSVIVNNIIDSVLIGMVSVCHNSTDAQHYYGASNVKPSYGGTPKDFERVINPILNAHSIDTAGLSGYFCNPYTIDFPKPYGKNPPLFTNTVSVIDTCGCSRYATIKTEALASSVDTSSFSAMNAFLHANYDDTLSYALWQGLRQCKYISACSPTYVPKYNSDGCDTTTLGVTNLSYSNRWVKFKDIFSGGVVHIPDSVYSHVTSGLVNDSINAKKFDLSTQPICNLDSFTVNYRLKTKAFSGTGAKLIILKLLIKPSNAIYYAYIGQNPTSGTGGLYKGGEGFPGIYTTGSLNNYFSSFKDVTLKFADSTLKIYIDGSYIFQRPVTETITGLGYITVQFINGVDGYLDYVNVKKLNGTIIYNEDFSAACNSFTALNKSGYKTVPLPEFVTLPAFLNCGYTKPCITCSKLDDLTTEFRAKFPSFSSVPYLDTTATEAQVRQNGLWARFLNYRTGFSKNVIDYLDAYNKCQTIIPTPSLAICSFTKALNDPSGYFDIDTMPCRYVQTQAQFAAQMLFQKMKDSLISNFDSLYKAKCFSARSQEQFYATYLPKEYHYTLYYYDQAGNLVKTIPPAGVKPNFDSTHLASVAAARIAGTDVSTTNNDSLATQYRYNTLEQVIAQRTPDAGISKFWYDRLGRLVVSQNAKQRVNNEYSYTLYDVLGRITEVGQSTNTTAMSQVISQDTTELAAWISDTTTTSKKQLTLTVYDLPYTSIQVSTAGISGLYQKNLRNRVSYSMVFDDENQKSFLSDSTVSGGNSATYYSYDIHGNVDTLLQDYRTGMGEIACTDNPGNRFKKMVYSYDLISGKVNDVAYQAGLPDQFYHRYVYDAENRITAVKTSRDKIYWEQDAAYDYYRHGPLSRTTIGQNQVQGLDYAYTIQGWLKGVNSTSVGDTLGNAGDMGHDGLTGFNSTIARDAFGFSLNYFTGDYKPISSSVTPFVAVPMTLPSDPISGISTATQLFNGNIGAMAVNVPKLGNPMVYGYRYDQLNRIVRMDAFTGLTNSTNAFSPSRTDDYHEAVSYDPNGNIRTYLRNGATATSNQAMDQLTYHYNVDGSGNLLNNKLRHVTDVVGTHTEDIGNQSSDNYTYDEIGNLIADNAEGIDSIYWTVYGKIKRIVKSGTTIDYTYDAAGNRISKSVTSSGVTKNTYYVRDASGNVMSLYQSGDAAMNSGDLTQTELHLYGSSRLGIFNVNVDVQCAEAITELTKFTRGNKFFELSNHLGNVLATISDKKIGHNSGHDTLDYNIADVVTANDYYPFGMGMPGRKYQAGSASYRYSINGQEKESELSENITNAEFWEYDSRLGRRWNMDPIYKNSPYEAFGDNPILFVDPTGADTTMNGKRYKDLSEVVMKTKAKMTLSKLERKFPGMMNFANIVLNGTIGGLYTGKYNTYAQKDPQKIDYLTEYQKQLIFKENAAKTTAILLREFQMGTGKETRYFNEFQHPIVSEIKSSIQASTALNAFAQDIKKGIIEDNKEYYYYGGSSPDKIPILASIQAHANEYFNSPAAFYRGGMRFYFTKTSTLIIVRAEDEYNTSSMLPSSRNESDNIYRQGRLRPFGQTKVVFQFYYTAKDGLDFSK